MEFEGIAYEEEWKAIIGYEGYYEVSNFGRIKSLARSWVTGERFGVRTKEDTIAKPGSDVGGYLKYTFCVDKIKTYWSGHVLVAKYFCDNPDNYSIVNHLNSIRNDNFFKNLEWTTYSGNAIHGFKHGFRKGQKGEDNPQTKLTKEVVMEIKKLWEEKSLSQAAIGMRFNIRQSQVSRIVTGARWAHIK